MDLDSLSSHSSCKSEFSKSSNSTSAPSQFDIMFQQVEERMHKLFERYSQLKSRQRYSPSRFAYDAKDAASQVNDSIQFSASVRVKPLKLPESSARTEEPACLACRSPPRAAEAAQRASEDGYFEHSCQKCTDDLEGPLSSARSSASTQYQSFPTTTRNLGIESAHTWNDYLESEREWFRPRTLKLPRSFESSGGLIRSRVVPAPAVMETKSSVEKCSKFEERPSSPGAKPKESPKVVEKEEDPKPLINVSDPEDSGLKKEDEPQDGEVRRPSVGYHLSWSASQPRCACADCGRDKCDYNGCLWDLRSLNGQKKGYNVDNLRGQLFAGMNPADVSFQRQREVTLQEAFQCRKTVFIERCQERQEQIQDKRSRRGLSKLLPSRENGANGAVAGNLQPVRKASKPRFSNSSKALPKTFSSGDGNDSQLPLGDRENIISLKVAKEETERRIRKIQPPKKTLLTVHEELKCRRRRLLSYSRVRKLDFTLPNDKYRVNRSMYLQMIRNRNHTLYGKDDL